MTWDVIVVGGGPVGLFLAGELRLSGASVLVLERLAEPDPAKDAGDRGLQVRTLQTLRLRGLLDTVVTRAAATGGPGIADFSGDAGAEAPDELRSLTEDWGTERLKGHFAMLPLLDHDGELADVPAQLPVWQGRFERVLAEWAIGLGAELLRGADAVDVVPDASGVTVTLTDGSHRRAGYLVGCDGAHSLVRKRSDFDFPGTEAAMVALLGRADFAPGDAPQPGIRRTVGGLLFVEPPPGQVVTAEFDVPDTARGPVTVEEFQASLRRVAGTEVTVVGLSGATRVTDRARQVEEYRHGRVLLAGDAAHVHSPMGGQGLNLGLQDAANLGWKLGLVARGLAPETLLDSYTVERHPVGARVLRDTRAQTALLRPDPHSAALREIVTDLIEVPGARRHLVELTTGLGIRYDLADPGAGGFLPEAAPAEAVEALRAGRGVLFGAADAADVAAGWTDRVRHLPGDDTLVRPDGYVAWAGVGELSAVLTHWFGFRGPSGDSRCARRTAMP